MKNPIVERIIEKLLANNQFEAEWFENNQANKVDGELLIRLEGNELRFPVEVKREIKKQHLIQIGEYKVLYPNLMIIADIINPTIRKLLKEKGVNYIDGAGNMFINEKGKYIHIEGNRNEMTEGLQMGRLFGIAGLKIIFALLNKEQLLNAPYRDIAEYTDTALGTVNYIINQLKINGYIIFINKETLKLKNKKKLMERWIAGYEDRLKKTLFIDKYRFRYNNWREIQFKDKNILWGGEPAAEILTDYIIPQAYTLYTKENNKDLILNYQLIPDENGNVEVYKKFWNFTLDNLEKTVPPLLVYTDLLNTNEPRNLETAQLIYEKYLQDKLD